MFHIRLKWIIAVILFSFSILPIGAFALKIFNYAMTTNGVFWQDEGINYNAAYSYWKDGYYNFRCTEGAGGGCYGGFQAFIDSMLLRFSSIIETDKFLVFPGKFWPWLAVSEMSASVLCLVFIFLQQFSPLFY